MNNQWKKPAAFAKDKNVSRRTVWRWMEEMGLPYVKVGGVRLINDAQGQEWLNEHVVVNRDSKAAINHHVDEIIRGMQQ